MLTFKRKLILTKAQERRINSWVGVCRFVYNLCKEIQQEACKNKGTYIHKYELMKQLTEIRNVDWIGDVPRDGIEDAIKRMDNSYKAFFKGGGFPKWASKKRFNSIRFKQVISVEDRFVQVPKLGKLKMVKDRPVVGKIKQITIKRQVDGYYACIATDAVKSIQCHDENQVLALDMGLKHFAVDSNGNYITNPRHFKTHERRLRIENRSLARKKKGGKNWRKQAHRLARLHNKIANVRRDFLHKESTRIAKANYIVILEDLNISGMAKNGNLSKHILDCGWGMFRGMLNYKTIVIVINPKYTSQTCNSCGVRDAKSRISQSEFVCTACGKADNADKNAANNILSKGFAFICQREAIACA